jgi:hypothetical protein
MLAVAAFLLVGALVVALFSAARELTQVARRAEQNRAGSIDQDLVEARLGRIEEAIDAMALQIERLTDHQRALLGGTPNALQEPIDPPRTERPR